MKSNYVLGFFFRGPRDYPEVALIQKNRPHWQVGKLNGIGGKIEAGDAELYSFQGALNAMVREFREETGLITSKEDWRQFGVLHHDGATIYLFACFTPRYGAAALVNATDERVGWYPAHALRSLPVMPNLNWMVPLALDKDQVTATILDKSPVPTKPAEVPA